MSPDFDIDHEAQMHVEERRIDDTHEEQRGDNGHNTRQSSAENHGDPYGKLWSMYLTNAKEEDDQITKNWTEDTGGVLVFTGLFSAIVAAFIIESYKKLSPDSGDQTVALLAQLINISTGAPVVVQNSLPFKAPASIVRVNVMWFLSLILSLTCALLATLMQQWARRCLEYAQHRGPPQKRMRIRAYMFDGVEKFGMSHAVEAMPLLLHTSVFLFFAGLIDFLLPIDKVVAFSALGCIVVFALMYMILTLLPTLRFNCPYRTPLSGITYISLQLSALNLFSIAVVIEGIFHGLLLNIWRLSHPNRRGSPNAWPTTWKELLEHKVITHYRWLTLGLRRRVELSAMEAPSRVEVIALQRTLTTLYDEKEFEDFVARMPGFFDSRAAPNATSAMLSLFSDQATPEPILGSRLRELLNTCTPGTPLLTEDQRKNRLRVCLKSLWYCLGAYNLPEHSEVPLAPYVRTIFASPEVIRWIRTEQDLATRLLGRCFGSLIVKKLADDITSSNYFGIAGIITAKMACLSYILGATGNQVKDWLDREGAIDLVNVISLASGELETLATSGTRGVPTDVVDVFQQTLGILAEGIVSSRANIQYVVDDLPPDQVTRFHEICSKLTNARVPDVLKERLRYISDTFPPSSSYTEEANPGPGSETTPAPVVS